MSGYNITIVADSFGQSFRANTLNFATYVNDSQQGKTMSIETKGKHPLCSHKIDCVRIQYVQRCD